MKPANSMPVLGILLAAGQGSRYSKQRPGADKLLAMVNNQTVLAASAMALKACTDYTVAVIHPSQILRKNILTTCGLEVLASEHSLQGMGASLAAAARFLQHRQYSIQPAGVLVALGDMPKISSQTYCTMVNSLRKAPIVAPVFNGQRGHPVGFHWQFIEPLSHLDGDKGARNLLQANGYTKVAVNDPGILYDIDLPSDL